LGARERACSGGGAPGPRITWPRPHRRPQGGSQCRRIARRRRPASTSATSRDARAPRMTTHPGADARRRSGADAATLSRSARSGAPA
jgi:hypothetical protein